MHGCAWLNFGRCRTRIVDRTRLATRKGALTEGRPHMTVVQELSAILESGILQIEGDQCWVGRRHCPESYLVADET